MRSMKSKARYVRRLVAAVLIILLRRWRYVNVRKLAKALGLDTKRATKVIMALETLGLLRRWRDRRGRFNIYVVTEVLEKYINNKTQT